MRGQLELPVGDRASVVLDGVIPDDPTVTVERTGPTTTTTTLSADPEKHVQAFAPRDLHGVLDTSEQVSLVEARNHGGSGHFGAPFFEPDAAIFGAHVTRDQPYTAIRFRLDDPSWLVHLTDGDSAVVPDDHSILRAEVTDGTAWLVYESAQPSDLDQLMRRAVSGCRALAWLVLDRQLVVMRTQVRISDGPWLRVHGANFEHEEPVEWKKPLLDPALLTVEKFAEWIAMHSRLDGLDWAVMELDSDRPVEVRAMLGTTLIEGFHRRLPFPQKRFPEASKNALRAIRSAATAAAEAEARKHQGVDPEAVREAVRAAVGHLGDVGFSARVRDMQAEVADVVPDLIAAVPDIAQLYKNARNDLAHHLRPRDGVHGASFLRWAASAHSLPWFLRAFLLTRAGYDHAALAEAIDKRDRYQYECANTRAFLRELQRVEAETQ